MRLRPDLPYSDLPPLPPKADMETKAILKACIAARASLAEQLLEGATGVFGDETKAEPTGPTLDVKTLHAKIGELTLENDFLSGVLGKAGLLGGKK
ncbi:insertion sequence transposase protein, IS3 family (plasmid) [Agrobacterium sp. RAC06]|nr:insertion sequence transposase protein, IS3 family [Agrobacterium sp. RAC06]